MSRDAEVDMKDVELNDVDPERQPMTAGNGEPGSPHTEKNGIVKLKMPEEKKCKFTGLSKEELLKVAGTPGWVRARWALLILFWLGWIGMLAGAIVIIIQAPRCKSLPEMSWWDNGPLYQIGDVNSFTKSLGLQGLVSKVSDMGDLKIKGVVVGPIHVSSDGKPEDLNFTQISPDIGTLTELQTFIEVAHKKSISVVLDLTPNYKGVDLWFGNSSVKVAEKVESATDYWLKNGVDGILLHGVERVDAAVPSFWSSIRETVNNHTTEEKKKVLIGVTSKTDADEVGRLLNRTGVDLLLSGILRKNLNMETARAVERLYSQEGAKLAWNFGDRITGHLASFVGAARVKLSQLLLLTLPGTPVFNYGDEIGLEDKNSVFPVMVWDSKSENESAMVEKSLWSFFKSVSELRVKERSLLHGEYVGLYNSTNALAYLRVWDQSERYIVACNWSPNSSESLTLSPSELPKEATVEVSTHEDSLAKGTSVNLAKLELKPLQAVMLKFAYSG